MLRTITATRYVTPLREGGSLPAIIEADDDGLYVLKFHGAGQGPKALIAELIAGEIARALGLPIPEIVFVQLDPVLGRAEPDFEIQALIKASAGLNLALDFLPGALTFDALDAQLLAPLTASEIVWFDAYVTNVDRTPRNTNMLWWHRRLMLIDHGASLYFHHVNANYMERSRIPFTSIKTHVLLPQASALLEADQHLKERLTPALLQDIVNLIPDAWLTPHAQGDTEKQATTDVYQSSGGDDMHTPHDATDAAAGGDALFADTAAHRRAYLDYLLDRLAYSHLFVEEALRARDQLL